MKKKQEIDPNYYDNHCFADDFIEAKKQGNLIKPLKGESTLEAIRRHMEAKKKKTVSMRLPIGVVDKFKQQAKAAGVPWTSYVCAVLERAVAKPRRA